MRRFAPLVAALLLSIAFTPAASARGWTVTAVVNCRLVYEPGGGFDGGYSGSLACDPGGHFDPSLVSARVGDTVQFNSDTYKYCEFIDGHRLPWTALYSTVGRFTYTCSYYEWNYGSRDFSVTINVTGPQVAFTARPPPGTTVSGIAHFAGNGSDAAGLDHLEYSIQGQPHQPITRIPLAANGSWILDLDTRALPSGYFDTLEVRAVARDGLVASATTTFVASNPETYDFRVQSFTITNDFGAPSGRFIQFAIRNEGNAAADAAWRIEYLYRGTWTRAASGSFHVDPFWDRTWGDSYAFPIDMVGRFPVRLVLDPADAVAELNESNNVAQTTIYHISNSMSGYSLYDKLP